MAEPRLYRMLCLSCGFVITGLRRKRPWPVVRRCALCEQASFPSLRQVREAQEAVDRYWHAD